MAIYKSVSAQALIARVVALTSLKETNYLFYLNDWIPQAMGLMKTKFVLKNKWEDVEIHFHKGELPCDLRVIKAVEYHGHRIERGNSVKTLDTPNTGQPHHNRVGTTNGFEYVPQFYNAPEQDNPQEDGFIQTQDLKSTSYEHCSNLPCADGLWYDVDGMDYILLSIPEARIRVHYRAIPVDEEGIPLVPDNEDYKMAVYYYCRAMMIGAGWDDKVLNYDKIMDMDRGYFWQHARRAMAQIRYPSVDSMEYKVNNHTRLIKDENYFHNYFSSPKPERKYGFDVYMDNISPGDAKTYLNDEAKNSNNNPTWGESGW